MERETRKNKKVKEKKKRKEKFIYQEGTPPITTIKKVTVRNEKGRGNKQKTERGKKGWQYIHELHGGKSFLKLLVGMPLLENTRPQIFEFRRKM